MPSWIEFHDSTLTAVRQQAGTREIVLDAYIHRWELLGDKWRGTGWTQSVRILMQNAVGPDVVPAVPVAISTGDLRLADAMPGGLVPFPFESTGDFVLSLHLTDGHLIEIAGRGLQIRSLNGPQFVEDLPEDMRPR